MLYDKRWDNRPSLAGFIAFLETRDPQERYNWWNRENCACGQYYAAMNLDVVHHTFSGRTFSGFDPVRSKLEYITQPSPWTFGAALKRAKLQAISA